MRVDGAGNSAATPRARIPGPKELRIVVQGQLTADVLMELDGFGVRAAEPGLLLFGNVADQAALGGTLRRLHGAGLVITAVEYSDHSLNSLSPASAAPVAGHRYIAEIEVAGTVPPEVGDLVECVGRRTTPATTTLSFSVSGDNDLFLVLDAFEEWGLRLRKVVTGI